MQHHPRNEGKQHPPFTLSKLISCHVRKKGERWHPPREAEESSTTQRKGKRKAAPRHGRGRWQHHPKEEDDSTTREGRGERTTTFTGEGESNTTQRRARKTTISRRPNSTTRKEEKRNNCTIPKKKGKQHLHLRRFFVSNVSALHFGTHDTHDEKLRKRISEQEARNTIRRKDN